MKDLQIEKLKALQRLLDKSNYEYISMLEDDKECLEIFNCYVIIEKAAWLEILLVDCIRFEVNLFDAILSLEIVAEVVKTRCQDEGSVTRVLKGRYQIDFNLLEEFRNG